MISSICRRRTSRETVAASDGSICSTTRWRSEADITGCWVVVDSSRLGVIAGELGLDAGKPGVNAGKQVAVGSSRVPNFLITRAASGAFPSARCQHQRSPVQLGRGAVAVLIRALEPEFRD